MSFAVSMPGRCFFNSSNLANALYSMCPFQCGHCHAAAKAFHIKEAAVVLRGASVNKVLGVVGVSEYRCNSGPWLVVVVVAAIDVIAYKPVKIIHNKSLLS